MVGCLRMLMEWVEWMWRRTLSAGPHIKYRVEAGTKNESDTFFVPVQKKGWKIDPHVSNLRSHEFLLQGVHRLG